MKRTILFITLMAFTVPLVLAQSTVSGTVLDGTTSDPLPGVNVAVKGTTQGGSTDMNGNYVVSVPSLQDTLVFSFIGFDTQEIGINGRSEINVTLAETVYELGEELVVTGYGSQERRTITGSIASLDEEDFVSGNVNSAAELIQGKVAGLQITTRNGNPNDEPEIRLRGISSFGANQSPLVVVDGVIGASLDNIDTNDIASIEVLKDASAAAIYGTRGSAGVLLVTTKQGEARRGVAVDYNAYYTFEGIENRLDVLTADEFRDLVTMTGRRLSAAPREPDQVLDLGENTEWFKEVTQAGSNMVHSLALSGGNANTVYRVSGNYRDRNGIQRYTGFQQIGGRLNLTQWAMDHDLELTFQLAATSTEQNFGFADAFKFAGIMNPTVPVSAPGFENTGGFYEQPLFNYFNPVAIIEEGTRLGEDKLFNGVLRGEYNLGGLNSTFDGLSLALSYSYQTLDQSRRNFYSRQHKVRGGATAAARGPGRAEQFYLDSSSELFEATLHYSGDAANGVGVEAIAGYSFNDFIDEGFNAAGGDFIAETVTWNNFQFAQDFSQGEGSVGSFRSTHRLIGFFGRANLNYQGTYFFNGSLRREGSSRFGIDNKWGLFWSAGVGVEITGLTTIPGISSLRARGSIGRTGQDAPSSGLALQRFAPAGNFFVNGQFIQSFGPVSNPNPDLKWEEKTEINLGVDFVAANARLSGRFDAYQSTTSDLLFEAAVPVPPNLYPTTWMNVGELETSGLEIQVDYDVLRGGSSAVPGLSWTTGMVASLYSETTLNKYITGDVQYLASPGSPGLNNPDLIRIKEGEPIGQLWGPRFSRIGDNGQWLFLKADGTEVEYGGLAFPDDEQILGNGLPDFQLGWTNSVSYGDFNLSIFVEGVFGHQLANMFSLFYSVPKQITSYNVLSDAFDLVDLVEDPRWSSYYIEDADYVRINNASLSYTIPAAALAGGPVRRVRVYVSGNNLLTFTGYSGLNPQVRYVDRNQGQSEQGSSGGPLAPGIERRIEYFTTRSISFGININL
ncbi:MAG: SusC/RagA family TonB-linked outer membrane protein [Bacteroidota bacterium]|nr:SusC/RagA family TonB-linked outer membrane protein [Bacteroidota bacterium]